ncbi:MAG: hypothetical protein C0594_00580 [Marinilabiliales bacterium]|nr:MAG: hypothetical protein C0594_00580 [Marinilabiliales bacterium]
MLIKKLPEEKRKFIHSLVFPTLFVMLLWIVKISESIMGVRLSFLGIYPLKIEGLTGILTSPLVHGDFAHLYANSIPLLTLGIGVFYFYRKIAYKVFFLIYFLTGISVWLAARESYHIGASGVVYGLASFLFFSGVIRKDARLLSISLIVIFLYGSMIWGIFPMDKKISWESHLMGGISGGLMAIFYRKQGPKAVRFSWETEDNKHEDEMDKESFSGYQDESYGYYYSTSGNEIRWDFEEDDNDDHKKAME